MKMTLALAFFALAGITPAADQAGAAAKPGSLVLTVAGENGAPLQGATVKVTGAAVDRAGMSGADGGVTVLNLPAGTYRARITRDGYVTLEKEVTIRAGARLAAEAVVTAAPPAPPPPPPPPAPTVSAPASTLKPGKPSMTFVVDQISQMDKELRNSPTVERDLGCSGATSTKLIMTRENVAIHTHADADEMLYIVAGEGTMAVADRDQAIEAGWFTVVPRGTSHSITRRGRNALLVLSVRSGPACPGL